MGRKFELSTTHFGLKH
jgi:hypothetical protein